MLLLWFDVEERYKTICIKEIERLNALWFDVEERYKTIFDSYLVILSKLWFDVEERYKTIRKKCYLSTASCGLM